MSERLPAGSRKRQVRGRKRVLREISPKGGLTRRQAEGLAEDARQGRLGGSETGRLAEIREKSNGKFAVFAGAERLPPTGSGAESASTRRGKMGISPRTEIDTIDIFTTKRERPSTNDLPDDEDYDYIRRLSLIVGLVHLLSGLAMIFWANQEFIISIVSGFAAGPPGCVENGSCSRFTQVNYEITMAYWVAGFSLLSAFFHLLTVTPGVYEVYRGQLEKGRNPFRWVEYAFSATLMILIIMLLSGLTNLTALIGVAFANVSMILFGWISEIMNPPDRQRTDWTGFIFGTIAGLGPWVAVYASLFINLDQLGIDWGAIPTFVWGIIISQFLLFNCFAINHALQFSTYRNYLTGEQGYIWLSLISKSILAWSIYANTAILS